MAKTTTFDKKALLNLLEPDNKDLRAKWRKIKEDPLMTPVYNMDLDYSRELAYKRLKMIADNKLISVYDFGTNPRAIFMAHEMCGTIDGSLATKMTVQWNLFGGTSFTFHTDQHKDIVAGIDSMKYVGCFCLTELGFGNNAVKMETTATWDQTTQEFVIHSPTIKSHKYWITNGACHAHFAVVFAQTIVHGKNEGLNIFMVRIRDDNLKPVKGVYIEDMGMKMSCNGVDNARIVFDNVRIPRTMLLNKICNMSPEGVFTHKVKKPRQRFIEVADKLLSGRICIAAMSNSSSKAGCLLGIKYSQQRLAVGPTGESDTPILNYQLQQNALFPLLAKSICLQFGLNKIKDFYHEFYVNGRGDHNELVRLCCVIKPLVTWNLAEVGGVTRERCGGQGYLSVNILGDLIGFAHAGITAEGDNRVLIQKVAKELTTDIAKGKIEHPKMTMCPKNQIPKLDRLDNLEVISNLLAYRQTSLVTKLINSMQTKIMEQGKPLFDVWMYQESDLIQHCGISFGDNYCYDVSFEHLKKGDFGATNTPVMTDLIIMYGLNLIEANLAWYLSEGVVSAEAGKKFEEVRSKIVKKIAPYAIDICDSFEIFPEWAPIISGYEAYNSKPNFGEHGAKPRL